jgi:hypothetical protein
LWYSNEKVIVASAAIKLNKEGYQDSSDYQVVYQRKVKDGQERFQQLQLSRSYLGCPQCGK